MKFEKALFEERVTTIHQSTVMDRKSIKKYINSCKNNIFPQLEKTGARVICLLQGLVGVPANSFLQFTRYPDIDTYHKIQNEFGMIREELIENEQVKFYKAITPRPKDPFPIEDQRLIYSNRFFYVNKKDIKQHADLTYNKVWPLYESWGVSVLGLFSSLSFEHLHEIKLYAGYNSVAHWEETRNITGFRPDNIETEIWEDGRRAMVQRAELTLKTNVCLMRKVYLPNP